MKPGDLVCLSDYVTVLFPGVTLWKTEHLRGSEVIYWDTPGVGILLGLGDYDTGLILTSTGHIGWTQTKNIKKVR